MSTFGNHSINFKFRQNSIPNGNPEYTGVYANNEFIGNLKRAGKRGWDYFFTNTDGTKGTGYVTGSRQDAAEMICASIGLQAYNEFRENAFTA